MAPLRYRSPRRLRWCCIWFSLLLFYKLHTATKMNWFYATLYKPIGGLFNLSIPRLWTSGDPRLSSFLLHKAATLAAATQESRFCAAQHSDGRVVGLTHIYTCPKNLKFVPCEATPDQVQTNNRLNSGNSFAVACHGGDDGPTTS
jgi:hypothetical protein